MEATAGGPSLSTNISWRTRFNRAGIGLSGLGSGLVGRGGSARSSRTKKKQEVKNILAEEYQPHIPHKGWPVCPNLLLRPFPASAKCLRVSQSARVLQAPAPHTLIQCAFSTGKRPVASGVCAGSSNEMVAKPTVADGIAEAVNDRALPNRKINPRLLTIFRLNHSVYLIPVRCLYPEGLAACKGW